MSRYKDSDCVGCETCANCGRRWGYMVYVCDECGDETTDIDEIHEIDGKDYCESCFTKNVGSEEE